MLNKNYVLESLKFLIPFYYKTKIRWNNWKIFKNNISALQIGFLGFIITFFLSYYQIIKLVDNSKWIIPIIFVYFIFIVYTIEVYNLIVSNQKIKMPDEIISKPEVLRLRKFNPKNFNLNLSPSEIRTLHDYFILVEFIKREITSLGVFDSVLRKDFGHNFKIVLNLNLAQIRCVFKVFEGRAIGFSSLARRKELFLNKDLKKISETSYRNTSSKNNKKALDTDFQNKIEQLEIMIASFSRK
ncbi:hypothetical protein [Aurantibacter sp.]|uniref:hypothetical protein n=1 Tax=Aurantibacter sp. TaxID=2807103 RepID=UPI003267E3C0